MSKLDDITNAFHKLTGRLEEEYAKGLSDEEELTLDLKGEEFETLILGAFGIDEHTIEKITLGQNGLKVKLKKG